MKFAQDLSSAQMISEAMTKRAEAAESMQKLMQDDIEEARAIQGYNAQLHKYVHWLLVTNCHLFEIMFIVSVLRLYKVVQIVLICCFNCFYFVLIAS